MEVISAKTSGSFVEYHPHNAGNHDSLTKLFSQGILLSEGYLQCVLLYTARQ